MDRNTFLKITISLPFVHFFRRIIRPKDGPIGCKYFTECVKRGFYPQACPCINPPPWEAGPEKIEEPEKI